MSDDHAPVSLTRSGPPETVLSDESVEVRNALARAASLPAPDDRRVALGEVAGMHPRCVEVWARLGDVGRDPIESYAYYRVGYHRGLDTLRGSGWRGSGYVRWRHETNRGFLRALEGLRRSAATIGEADEAERCEQFLHQLDPAWPPAELL